MKKTIYLETFGCQMNVLDSELVENQLRALGYEFVTQPEAARVVLYNTCSVRELSEQKVWSRLGLLKQRKRDEPEVIVGVIGCMAEREGTGLMKRFPQVDLMCGPGELDRLPGLLENFLLTGTQQHALAGNTARRSSLLQSADEDGLEMLDLARSFSPHDRKYQAYIRVVRGCNKFCTYCVVPYTRGPEVSRPPENILEEARKLVDAGCLEITLLGQTVNHYHYERPASVPGGVGQQTTTFAELLHMLHESLPTLPRLRFVTSFPASFGNDILDVMATSPRICRYLHIPAQSGSDRLLKMMNRGYTVAEYDDLLQRTRERMPDIHLAGDIIVGFPTETDADYEATRALVQRSQYKNCFIFKYSSRPGTLADKRYPDDVPDAVKRQRNNDLLSVQDAISEQLNRRMIGQEVNILCEGPSGWKQDAESVVAGTVKMGNVELGGALAQAYQAPRDASLIQMVGRTAADQIVVCDGHANMAGKILRVRITAAHAMTIFGDVVGEAAPTAALSPTAAPAGV